MRAANLQKSTKICLTWQLLFRSFHWGPNLVFKTFQVWSGTFYQENFEENHGHNILRLFDVNQTFVSPLGKQSVIISNKHGIYELSYELPNYLRLWIFEN